MACVACASSIAQCPLVWSAQMGATHTYSSSLRIIKAAWHRQHAITNTSRHIHAQSSENNVAASLRKAHQNVTSERVRSQRVPLQTQQGCRGFSKHNTRQFSGISVRGCASRSHAGASSADPVFGSCPEWAQVAATHSSHWPAARAQVTRETEDMQLLSNRMTHEKGAADSPYT